MPLKNTCDNEKDHVIKKKVLVIILRKKRNKENLITRNFEERTCYYEYIISYL